MNTLASIAVWMFFTAFWEILVSLTAQSLQPIQYGFLEEILVQTKMDLMLSRISPNTLFVEATVALLFPTVRSLGLLLPFELQDAILGAPLPDQPKFLADLASSHRHDRGDNLVVCTRVRCLLTPGDTGLTRFKSTCTTKKAWQVRISELPGLQYLMGIHHQQATFSESTT